MRKPKSIKKRNAENKRGQKRSLRLKKTQAEKSLRKKENHLKKRAEKKKFDQYLQSLMPQQ